jgi:succinyl-diaminopimelate desuccinylase
MSERLLTNIPILTPEEQSLLASVDQHKDALIQLLQALIKIDSQVYNAQTYSDLQPIFSFVEEYLAKMGFLSTYFKCPHLGSASPPSSTSTWPNLISRFEGSAPGKTLQFMGHLDTVPYDTTQWDPTTPPLGAVIKQGKLYGRGAIDMKGGIAAQMLAMELFKRAQIPFSGRIQMWFVPDEEIDAPYGARWMASHHLDAINADSTVISEPTGQSPIKNPAIIIGEKGLFWVQLRFFGSAGHGSMPKPKSNAINKATRFISQSSKWKLPHIPPPLNWKDLIRAILSRYRISDLIKIMKTPDDSEPDLYNEDGLPIGNFFKTTLSFNQIHAGSKVNVIPDTCVLEFDVRILPGIRLQQLFDSLVAYCTKIGYHIELPPDISNSQHSNSKLVKRPKDIEAILLATTNGTFVDQQAPFAQLMAQTFEAVYHVKTAFFFAPGSSDATHIRNKGVQNVVLFGPSGENAHGHNECVDLEQLLLACKFYLLLIYRFFQQ